MARDPLKSAQWKALRLRIIAASTHCWLCREPLTSAPWPSRWSSTVDHVVPRHHGGDVFDPDNLRAAHLGCNSSRGARAVPHVERYEGVVPSRVW